MQNGQSLKTPGIFDINPAEGFRVLMPVKTHIKTAVEFFRSNSLQGKTGNGEIAMTAAAAFKILNWQVNTGLEVLA